MSVAFQKKAQSVEKSLITPIAFTIAAADFDLYLQQIDSYFAFKEAWMWMTLVNGASEVLAVEVEQVDSHGVPFATILTMRLGAPVICQGIRILSAGTDPSAVLTVGTGQ